MIAARNASRYRPCEPFLFQNGPWCLPSARDPVDVTLNVRDALDRYALIPDDSDVTVDTSGNTVTLAGHVRTWAEHDATVDAAWMATGVYDAGDDLYVTG